MDRPRRAADKTLRQIACGPAGHVTWSGRRGSRALGALAVAIVVLGALASSAFGARPSSVEGSGFTVEKLQLIAGTDAGFTTGELTGEVGQTIEYEIVVINTGEFPQQFSPLSDPNCTGISPSGPTELQAAESERFTCQTLLSKPGRWTNKAEIEAGEIREASNEVIVEVPEKRGFTVEKLQTIEGTDSGFTKLELTAKVGQTVEYEIIVANTGNTELTFSPLEDTNCSNTSPAGTTELAAGQSETFTCEHTLTTSGQIWSNEATVTSGEVSEHSNMVFVQTLEEPEFTIEKLQQIDGSGADFTKSELTAKLGQTIDYQIAVVNTGSAPLEFSPLSDLNCTNIAPAGATELAPGASETFTCQHALSAVGAWTNHAEIEGALKQLQKPSIRPRVLARARTLKKVSSNQVVANVPAEANFEIEKLQSIAGSGAAFTKAELQGALGQIVDYDVIVRNTGNVPLKLSALIDANCAGISPSGMTELAVGGSETFTCEHALTSAGSYTNEAAIEGGGKSKVSNKVIVSVPQPLQQQQVKAACTISGSLFVLHGASGSKRKPFTLHIQALGIKQITFYIDGRELKTLSAGQAKNGEFAIRIDPSRLRYGAHRVSVKTVMTQSACATVARSAVFVRPRPAAVKPKFTG